MREVIRVMFLRIEEGASVPRQATPGSSGFDLRACVPEPSTIPAGSVRLVPTGLRVAIPEGYEGQVRARSGLALRHGIGVINGPGTIDSDYRGPLGVLLINLGETEFTVSDGDRIAQIVFTPVPSVELVEVRELPETGRGEGGFGHTGIE